MSKQEFVELQGIRIPKPIMDFFEKYWQFIGYTEQTAKEYLVEHMNRYGPSLIHNAVFDEIRDYREDIMENHGLEPYKELMGYPKTKEVKKIE